MTGLKSFCLTAASGPKNVKGPKFRFLDLESREYAIKGSPGLGSSKVTSLVFSVTVSVLADRKYFMCTYTCISICRDISPRLFSAASESKRYLQRWAVLFHTFYTHVPHIHRYVCKGTHASRNRIGRE